MGKKNKTGGTTLPDFRQCYKTIEIKTVWYWPKTDISVNGTEDSPEINPHTYSQLIFNKGGKLYNGEKTVSSASGAGKVGQPHVKQ